MSVADKPGKRPARKTGFSNLDLRSLFVKIGERKVGTLALTASGVLAFEYDAAWIEDGYSISPLSLPLEKRVFVAGRHPLDGVFGVFDDSLPDGWGRLLVDRLFRSKGIDPLEVGPIGRLAVVGSSGMGALEYEPSVSPARGDHSVDLDEVAEECRSLLESDFSEDLDTLFELGGSSGGARPKILTKVDGEDWIIKFPSSSDVCDIGLREYNVSLAARSCGVEMAETRLFPSKYCAGYFGTKRFDRILGEDGRPRRVHMASAGALLETSHRTPNLDYDLLMRLTLRLTDDFGAVERLYRLMCFNVYVGNKDDHAKNFAFLFDEAAHSWVLSPAYDLTRNAGMGGEHATMVNGKGSLIEDDDLLAVAKRAGMSASLARKIEREVRETVVASRADL